MFRKKFYENLDPSYLEQLKKLEKEIKSIHKNSTEIRCQNELLRILTPFCNQFMMPRKIWDLLINSNMCNEKLQILGCQAVFQFCYNENYMDIYNLTNKLLDTREWVDERYDDISLPHSEMEKAFAYCEKKSCSLLRKPDIEKYLKMKNIYEKIIAAEKDENEWIKALQEVDDHQFIEQNIELRISKNITNKKLWKLYLEYLKKYNVEKMLQTFSKYCRFFLDDIEAKESYKQEAKKYGQPVYVPWTNPFEFEIYDKTVAVKESIQYQHSTENYHIKKTLEMYNCKRSNASSTNDENYIPNIKKQKLDSTKINFSQISMQPQNFSFQQTTVHYMLQKCDANLRQKLFQTGKYFFIKYPTPICYKLILEPSNRSIKSFNDQSLLLQYNNADDIQVHKYIISTRLWIYSEECPNLLSKYVIPKIFKCEAKYIEIQEQNLTDIDLKVLIGHGNVEELIFRFGDIKNENGDKVALEDIMKMTPKIRVLEITQPFCTKNTASIINELHLMNKLRLFKLTEVNHILEPHAFFSFIKKNASFNSAITVRYNQDLNEDEKNNFVKVVKKGISSHWKNKDAPIFLCKGFYLHTIYALDRM